MVDKTRQLAIDPACESAVAALEDDPFCRSICVGYRETSRRRAALAEYFNYSIQEGSTIGRCVHLADPRLGVAVWLLPQSVEVKVRSRTNKRAFLESALTAEGCRNYYQVVEFMSAKSKSLVDHCSWYLSIIAVDPAVQGRGLGRKLLESTIAEADRCSATCYLETFTPRSISFYNRLGFEIRGRFAEPTTSAEYVLTEREPFARVLVVAEGTGRER